MSCDLTTRDITWDITDKSNIAKVYAATSATVTCVCAAYTQHANVSVNSVNSVKTEFWNHEKADVPRMRMRFYNYTYLPIQEFPNYKIIIQLHYHFDITLYHPIIILLYFSGMCIPNFVGMKNATIITMTLTGGTFLFSLNTKCPIAFYDPLLRTWKYSHRLRNSPVITSRYC